MVDEAQPIGNSAPRGSLSAPTQCAMRVSRHRPDGLSDQSAAPPNCGRRHSDRGSCRDAAPHARPPCADSGPEAEKERTRNVSIAHARRRNPQILRPRRIDEHPPDQGPSRGDLRRRDRSRRPGKETRVQCSQTSSARLSRTRFCLSQTVPEIAERPDIPKHTWVPITPMGPVPHHADSTNGTTSVGLDHSKDLETDLRNVRSNP